MRVQQLSTGANMEIGELRGAIEERVGFMKQPCDQDARFDLQGVGGAGIGGGGRRDAIGTVGVWHRLPYAGRGGHLALRFLLIGSAWTHSSKCASPAAALAVGNK